MTTESRLRVALHGLAALLFGIVALLASNSESQAAKRVALVIGNSAYQNAPALTNPANDAADMAAALRNIGFTVVEGLDLTNRAMRDKIREFSSALRGADAAMFYYAGHAMQVNGKNQLAPIDTRLEFESDLDFETISLEFIQTQMEKEVETILIFLDACRDNPLTRSFRAASRSGGAGTGLAEAKTAASGTFIAFSTNPGNVALDGKDRNSPFTKALLNNIGREGVEISTLMTDVRLEVVRETNGAQTPWINSSLLGRFYFNEGATAEAKIASAGDGSKTEQSQIGGQSQAVNSAQIEALAYNAVKDSNDKDELRAFIQKFGSSFYGDLVRLKLKRLEDASASAAAVETKKVEEQTKVAALEVPKEPETRALDVQIDPVELNKQIQTKLGQFGCGGGKPDGIWGKGSQNALTAFARSSKLQLVSTDPSAELLKQIQEYNGKGCIVQSCPSGQKLSSKGQCFTPKKQASVEPVQKKRPQIVRKQPVGGQDGLFEDGQPVEDGQIVQEGQPVVVQGRRRVLQQQPVMEQEPTVGQRLLGGIGVGIGVGVSSCILTGGC